MKKILLILFALLIVSQAFSQDHSYDLPPEFKDVAVQAFEKVSPATRQWFVNAAAQHPAGLFDTLWTRKKLKEKFTEQSISLSGDLMVVMMAYQKMMNEEARENRKFEKAESQHELTSKENKIKIDNVQIEQQKKEAQEKAENAMNAAQTNLWIGIVSGATGMGSSNPHQINQNMQTVRISPNSFQKIDSLKLKTKNANLNDQKQKAEQDKAAAEEAKKANEDHKKAMKDALKKLLDQMAEMSRNTNS